MSWLNRVVVDDGVDRSRGVARVVIGGVVLAGRLLDEGRVLEIDVLDRSRSSDVGRQVAALGFDVQDVLELGLDGEELPLSGR